jgi:hypothetical protein
VASYEKAGWQFGSSFNVYTPADVLDQARQRLWAIKEFLTGGAGSPGANGHWTVKGSSDGSAAGLDGVDRWTTTYTPAKIVRGSASNPHSWMVLESPTLSSGIKVQLLITFDGSNDYSGSFIFAKTAFSGGSTTANPTSSDSWMWGGTASAFSHSSTATLHRLHGILSSTGDFFIFSARSGGGGFAEFALACMATVGHHASDAVPVWTFSVHSGGVNVTTPVNLQSSSNNTRSPVNTAAIQYLGVAQPGAPSVDPIRGTYASFPSWIFISYSSSLYGRGRVPDLGTTVMQTSTGTSPCVTGSTIRDSENNIAYITVGSLIIPFNTTVNMS